MILPFKIKSITVKNTGLGESDVEGIEWIDATRISITNKVRCVGDDLEGGTCVSFVDEFEWDFNERDFFETLDPYVHIELVE